MSKKNHPWTATGGVVLHLSVHMDPTKTPHVACVTVSTAEKPAYNRRLDVSPEELKAIAFLVKECGWYWREAGVLRRHKFAQEAA